jgi:hypothetical protein
MSRHFYCETVPGTGEVARFPAETLGTHKEALLLLSALWLLYSDPIYSGSPFGLLFDLRR